MQMPTSAHQYKSIRSFQSSHSTTVPTTNEGSIISCTSASCKPQRPTRKAIQESRSRHCFLSHGLHFQDLQAPPWGPLQTASDHQPLPMLFHTRQAACLAVAPFLRPQPCPQDLDAFSASLVAVFAQDFYLCGCAWPLGKSSDLQRLS